jgi:hypothetical protein
MGESKETNRKSYEPPALVVHGDLRTVTGGGTSNSKEGGGSGNPSTKM